MNAWTRSAGLLALGLCLTASSCLEELHMSSIDPPSLKLDFPPRINQVTVTNGAGEVLMSGDPGYDGKFNADPPLEQFDGKLTIEYTWDNGVKRTQTAEHEPGKPISLTYSSTLQRFEVETVQPRAAGSAAETPERGE